MSHFKVTITVEIPECEDEQEAIDFVEDNISLSEFHLEVEHLLETGRIIDNLQQIKNL